MRILVGHEAAGTLDVIARTLALKLQSRFGRRFAVVNRTGAGGGLALDALRVAPADGSVMLLTPVDVLSRRGSAGEGGDATTAGDRAPEIVAEVASSALAFGSEASVRPLLRSGRLRAVALGGEARSRYLPGVPTFAESGQPHLAERERFVLALPAGANESIVEAMAGAVAAVLRDGDVRDIWARLALSG